MLKTDWKYPALISALGLVFFWKVLLSPGKIIFSEVSDLIFTETAWKFYLAESFQKFGQVPLWNHYSLAGTFMAGHPGASLFYPPTYLYLLFPSNAFFGISIMVGFILAGIFMYIFARQLEIGRYGALVSGVTYAFGSATVMKLVSGHIWFLRVIVLAPLVFYFFDRSFKKLRYAIPAAAVLALAILGGEPQLPYYLALALCLYWLHRSFSLHKLKDWQKILPTLKVPILVLLMAGLLVSAQALPSFETAEHSRRFGGSTYADATSFSLPPISLLTLALPELFGSHMNATCYAGFTVCTSMYLGIITILLAALGLYLVRNHHTRYFAILGALALLFALGKYTPLFHLFYYVPGVAIFKSPARILYLFSFSVSILAGFGASAILRKRKLLGKISKPLIILFVLVMLGTAAFMLLHGTIHDYGTQLLSQKYAEFSAIPGYTPEYSMDVYLSRIDTIYWAVMGNLLMLGFIVGGAGLLFRRYSQKKADLNELKLLLLLLIVVDLFIFGMKYVQVTGPDDIFGATGAVRFLEQDKGIYRILLLNEVYDTETLIQHRAIRYGIEKIRGYDSTEALRYRSYFDEMVGAEPGKRYQFFDVAKPKMLDMLNGKYLVVIQDSEKFGFHLNRPPNVFNDDTGRYKVVWSGTELVALNNEFLPRAFFVPDSVAVEGEMDALRAVSSDDFEPREYVVLETGRDYHGSGEFTPAEITFYSPNQIKISLDSPGNGFLVLSDSWFPGWEAYLNGEQVPVLRANYLVRAVHVGKGAHEVEFVFRPKSVRTGLTISLLTALTMAVAYAFLIRKPI